MFNEAEYYTEFKKVRNRFRKYRYCDLIEGAIAYINAPVKDNIESIKRRPWMVLLFVKWIFLDDHYPNGRGKVATKNDVHSLLQLTYDLSDKLRMPDEYDHHGLFLINTAFQQFPYQIGFHYTHLARQSILFSDLDKNHYICNEFVRHTELEVQDFLGLSLIILARLIDFQGNFFPEKLFYAGHDIFPAHKVKRFLELISKDFNGIRQALLDKDSSSRRLAAENYEMTPFIEFPLIKVSGGYVIAHKNILFRRLDHYVYDFMRSKNPNRFMDKFGEMFERCVEDTLNYSGTNFFTEGELARLIGMTGNRIDFVIKDASANIFVDAKAVEMNAQGKITHSVKILRDKTRDSILKAIKQAHDVIKQIANSGNSEISSSNCNYLLVVTFKELYLSGGATYYEVVAKDKIDEIYKEYSGYCCIPPENMFFITIDDLDILAGILKEKEYSLSEILEFAKNNDKDPMTRKFIFIQHIESLNLRIKTPDHLVAEIERMSSRILAGS